MRELRAEIPPSPISLLRAAAQVVEMPAAKFRHLVVQAVVVLVVEQLVRMEQLDRGVKAETVLVALVVRVVQEVVEQALLAEMAHLAQ